MGRKEASTTREILSSRSIYDNRYRLNCLVLLVVPGEDLIDQIGGRHVVPAANPKPKNPKPNSCASPPDDDTESFGTFIAFVKRPRETPRWWDKLNR